MISLVVGHVGDIGEPVAAYIPFERVSTTTNPHRRGIPKLMMEDAVARGKEGFVLAHLEAARCHCRTLPPGASVALTVQVRW